MLSLVSILVKGGNSVISCVQLSERDIIPLCFSNSLMYFKYNKISESLFRRLCPDLFFFQKATDYPCKEIIHADSRVETLRKRVEQCVLQSETVKVDRLGNYNVSVVNI